MIVDAKIDYKLGTLNLIADSGQIIEQPIIKPYFYILVRRKTFPLVKTLLSDEVLDIVETNYKAVVADNPSHPTKYVVADDFIVAKVIVESPAQVPKMARRLIEMNLQGKLAIAGHNVRFIVRNCFDRDVKFFNAIPLYYGFDSRVMDYISKVTLTIIDVEVIDGEPRICSVYKYKPFSEVHRDDVQVLELPRDMDLLAKTLEKAAILAGHNIIGFDLPVLRRIGIDIDDKRKSFFDIVLTLNTYGSAFQIGSARSLLDLAIVLREKAGITKEEIDLKKSGYRILKGKNIDEITRYNINDVVLTAKIANLIYPFIAVISALTQIPPSEVVTLPPGLVAEYYLLRFCELLGYIPEYHATGVELTGERVWLEAEGAQYTYVVQADIKAMYPSFVLFNYIDPMLTVDAIGYKFDRRQGLGLLYSATKRLYIVREVTKKLKKTDKRFEALDGGVKAIINSLAYGVQGKQSGLAIFGNPVTPRAIFYGTRDVQFKLISYARENGYRVIYSDTDSIFVAFGRKPSDEEVKAMIGKLNEFLRQYGLELDVEDIWDLMYIYGKKNYILKKGDKVVVKGSALHNLFKFWLPQCISMHELLKIEDKRERLKYVTSLIIDAPIEELFIRVSQQVWRLIGKDWQAVKRLKEKASRYLRVLTPWAEKPCIWLKKMPPHMMRRPDTAPLVKLLADGHGVFDLASYNAHDIVDTMLLRCDDLKFFNLDADLLIYDGKIYAIKVTRGEYVLRIGKDFCSIPLNYGDVRRYMNASLVEIRAEVKVKEVHIDEESLRNMVLAYVKDKLREYNII